MLRGAAPTTSWRYSCAPRSWASICSELQLREDCVIDGVVADLDAVDTRELGELASRQRAVEVRAGAVCVRPELARDVRIDVVERTAAVSEVELVIDPVCRHSLPTPLGVHGVPPEPPAALHVSGRDEQGCRNLVLADELGQAKLFAYPSSKVSHTQEADASSPRSMCVPVTKRSPSQEVLDENAQAFGRDRLLRMDGVAADLTLVREDTVKEKRDQGRPFEPSPTWDRARSTSVSASRASPRSLRAFMSATLAADKPTRDPSRCVSSSGTCRQRDRRSCPIGADRAPRRFRRTRSWSSRSRARSGSCRRTRDSPADPRSARRDSTIVSGRRCEQELDEILLSEVLARVARR